MNDDNVSADMVEETTENNYEQPAGNDIPVQPATRPEITFQGNNYDLMSVVGVVIGGSVLFTCATCNFGFYCLPFIPIILGIIGLLTTKDAVDPDRTRLLSWISIGSGTAILILIGLFILAYLGFFFFMIAAAEGNGGF